MIVAFWCVLVAALLPIGCSVPRKVRQSPAWPRTARARFDNREPRAWLARQTGVARPRQRGPAEQLRGVPVLRGGRRHRGAAARRRVDDRRVRDRVHRRALRVHRGCTWPTGRRCARWRSSSDSRAASRCSCSPRPARCDDDRRPRELSDERRRPVGRAVGRRSRDARAPGSRPSRSATSPPIDGCTTRPSPKLFAIALRILREESRAEDVLQDSFVNVWNGAASYNARCRRR